MYELLRSWAVAILKVPAEPHPPIGDPASLRVFRAGRNYFRLRMGGWAVAEVIALAGLIFWTAFLIQVEGKVRERRSAKAEEARAGRPTTPVAAGAGAKAGGGRGADDGKRRRETLTTRMKENIRKSVAEHEAAGKPLSNPGKGWESFKLACVEVALLLPAGAFAFIWALKIFGMAMYLAQLPLTYAVRRLDYEMRWYMVTDRSLRLRHGVWKISESTMSFANIQQVVVAQGPLQRLLGLADVKVKTAGGGGGHPHQHGEDMHSGLFHSVTNAAEIRDLILERLRRFREAGLGDPDEKLPDIAFMTDVPRVASADGKLSDGDARSVQAGLLSSDAVSAARDLAAEARALRAALETVR
jgi:membrane protein YdbS with pleckstrin-like domain